MRLPWLLWPVAAQQQRAPPFAEVALWAAAQLPEEACEEQCDVEAWPDMS